MILSLAAGIAVPTPLDEVKALDALMPTILRPSPKLDAVLATAAEVKRVSLAMGMSEAEIDKGLATLKKDQQPPAGPPIDFTATDALLSPVKKGVQEVDLFGGGQRVRVTLVMRDDHTAALLGAPDIQAGTLPDTLAHTRNDDLGGAFLFTRKAGAWVSASLPSAKAVTVKIAVPDDTHFVAEASSNGGLVRINEANKVDVVSVCKEGP